MPWCNTDLEATRRAVDSVIGQDYPGPFELVICCDGGDCRNIETVVHDALVRQTATIEIVHHPRRQGISAARNSAVAASRADYLVWLDADDTLPSSALSDLAEETRASSALISLAQCIVIERDGTEQRRSNKEYLRLREQYRGTVHDPLMNVVFACQPQLVSAALFDRVEGFDPHFVYAEMTDFTIRALELAGDRVAVAESFGYRYTRTEGSHSTERPLLERGRKRALQRYAADLGLRVDGLTYLGRCVETGAQHYAPRWRGDLFVPPFVDVVTGVHGNTVHLTAGTR